MAAGPDPLASHLERPAPQLPDEGGTSEPPPQPSTSEIDSHPPSPRFQRFTIAASAFRPSLSGALGRGGVAFASWRQPSQEGEGPPRPTFFSFRNLSERFRPSDSGADVWAPFSLDGLHEEAEGGYVHDAGPLTAEGFGDGGSDTHAAPLPLSDAELLAAQLNVPVHILRVKSLGIGGVSVANPVRRRLATVSRAWWFDFAIMTTVFANIIVLCLHRPLDDPRGRRAVTLACLNLFFTCAFALEMLIKLCALGPWRYVRNYWHWLDVAVVVAGFVDFAFVGQDTNGDGSISALRAARALRPLRTVQFFPGLKLLVTTIVNSLPMVSSVVLVCVYLLVLYGILAVDMFGDALSQNCVAVGPDGRWLFEPPPPGSPANATSSELVARARAGPLSLSAQRSWAAPAGSAC